MTNVRSNTHGQKSMRGCRHDTFSMSPTVESLIRSNLTALFQETAATLNSGADRFKYSYLEGEIFSKYLDPSSKEGVRDRKDRAISKWRRLELRNAVTNVRLYVDECQFTFPGRKVSSDQILSRAADTVKRVLGDSPDLETLYGTFTSGASTQLSREPGNVALKFMDEAHVTASALPHFRKIAEVCEGWRHISDDVRGSTLQVEIVRGSVMFTVPKTSEIDRCAAMEPGLNMFLQKGVGAFIGARLRSVLRQDLNDQTRNQRLARRGSLDGSLATLDLSSASDTISTHLVCRLLPLDWFCLLNDIRSKECCVEGEWMELNMFSSMGNAFTFELESLIFWSLVNAIAYFAGVRGTISVYGDDIVCPRQIAGLVAQVFAFMGFKVNPKKSFWRGPFRESCGKHWYKGIDVTPFYVREPIGTLPRVIHFFNRLKLWASDGKLIDSRVDALWGLSTELVPRRFRGGSDCESIYQLVSDEAPVDRLLPRSKTLDGLNMAGSYLHWLRAADRDDPRPYVGAKVLPNGCTEISVREPLITSDVKVVLPYYRVVPAKAYSTGMEPH